MGTLIIFMSVPFCFGQTDASSIRSRRLQIAPLTLHTPPESCGCLSLLLTSFYSPYRSNPIALDERRSFIQDEMDTLKSDTTARKPAFKKFRMKKSPWLAVGLSAVLPGAGQFYNQSYWKVPILLGIAGYLGYEYYDNDKKYRDYRDQYAASQTPENEYLGDENLKTLREFYRNQRNDFVWYFAILYVVNLIDAYVDAHLFDFNVKEDKIQRFGTVDREYKLNVKVRF